MSMGMKRREFLGATAVSGICLSSLTRPVLAQKLDPAPVMRRGTTKTRVGRVYLGNANPGWPLSSMDLNAEVQRFESEFTKLQPALDDIEFVDGGLISSLDQLPAVMEKFQDIDGILALHLTLGTGPYFAQLLELPVPLMLFSLPYAGHEWHTVAALQKQGKKIDVLPSSDFEDMAVAVRPFRAIHRLKEARILFLQQGGPNPDYVQAIKNKFGTEIVNIEYEQLADAYKSADQDAVLADAEKWIADAEKIVEPTREEILKASRMYLALAKLLEDETADLITINCLGMGLIQRGLAYPCLGFSRLSSMGLGGVCEADLKSSMTHLIFQSLTGKPGFVSDPVIDLSQNAVIHAHCVSPIKMDGPHGEQSPYIIRNHLEDAQGVSLYVRMRIGQPISMARLIGQDIMLFSTGEIIDTPYVERGCRTKITTRVKNAQKILENYSCGLHRVIFYGDHSADLRRFCRYKDIRLVLEDEEDTRDIPGLEWEPYVHA